MIDVEATLEQYKPLAKSAAIKLHRRVRNLELEDAFQLVRIQVWSAASSFDPNMGASLTTWIMRHINQLFSWEITNSRRHKRTCVGIVSIDPVGGADDGSIELGASPPDPVDALNQHGEFTRLIGCLSVLKPREREVLHRRFVNNETLDSIGQRYDLTRERIRQIERDALDKLRKRLGRQE